MSVHPLNKKKIPFTNPITKVPSQNLLHSTFHKSYKFTLNIHLNIEHSVEIIFYK